MSQRSLTDSLIMTNVVRKASPPADKKVFCLDRREGYVLQSGRVKSAGQYEKTEINEK